LSLDDDEVKSDDDSDPEPTSTELGVTVMKTEAKSSEVTKTRIPYDEDTYEVVNIQGTKLAHLVRYLIEIGATDTDDGDTRVLIFSQYSVFLHLISSTLEANGISNEYCQGNVHVKSRIIQNFQDPTAEDEEKEKAAAEKKMKGKKTAKGKKRKRAPVEKKKQKIGGKSDHVIIRKYCKWNQSDTGYSRDLV